MVCMQGQELLVTRCGRGGRVLQRSFKVLGLFFDGAEWPFTILRR
jgi:hypothetical protein